MKDIIIPILVAIVGSGVTTAIVKNYLDRRQHKRNTLVMVNRLLFLMEHNPKQAEVEADILCTNILNELTRLGMEKSRQNFIDNMNQLDNAKPMINAIKKDLRKPFL